MVKLLVSAYLISSISVYASPNFTKNSLLNLPVSCNGLSRITVKENKIQDVVVYPDPFSLEEAEFFKRTAKAELKGDFKDGISISTEDMLLRKSSRLAGESKEQWQRGTYFIQLYKDQNESTDSVPLRSYEVHEPQDQAIAFHQRTVAPGVKA